MIKFKELKKPIYMKNILLYNDFFSNTMIKNFIITRKNKSLEET